MKDLNIKHLKLINGEEIISLVNQSIGDDLILEFPLLLNSIYDNNTNTYYFTKYMNLTNDSLIHMNVRNIIAYSTVTDDIKRKYIVSSLSYKEDQLLEERRVNKEIDEKVRRNINNIINEDDDYAEEYDDELSPHTLH
jgi:hypothetical protein